MWGLSTQAAATVYVATIRHEARRAFDVCSKTYRLVIRPAYGFFGAVEADAYGSRVMMAESEKAIVDALDRPA